MAPVASDVAALREQVEYLGGELDGFRDEVTAAFVEVRGHVDRLGRRVDRLTRPHTNGTGYT